MMSDARGEFIELVSHSLVVEPSHLLLYHSVSLAADCPLQGFPAIHPIYSGLALNSN
jgi:hypothetical protein